MGRGGVQAADTLEDPTSTFEYDLFTWQTTGKPNWAKSRVRETHQDPDTRWLEQRSYFSGAGAVVMVKAQARPGLAPQRDENGELILDEGELVLVDTSPNLRWIGCIRAAWEQEWAELSPVVQKMYNNDIEQFVKTMTAQRGKGGK